MLLCLRMEEPHDVVLRCTICICRWLQRCSWLFWILVLSLEMNWGVHAQ